MPEVHVIPDITLFVQLAIFLVFMFIMKKIYFDPYLEAFDEREKTVEQLLAEAEEKEDAKKEVAMTVEIEKKTMDKIIEKMAEEIAEKLLLKEKAA